MTAAPLTPKDDNCVTCGLPLGVFSWHEESDCIRAFRMALDAARAERDAAIARAEAAERERDAWRSYDDTKDNIPKAQDKARATIRKEAGNESALVQLDWCRARCERLERERNGWMEDARVMTQNRDHLRLKVEELERKLLPGTGPSHA